METDELLHVFDAHTANAIKLVEGEEELYSKDELLSAIKEAIEELYSFRENWLLPLIEEVDGWRSMQ